MSAVRYYHLKCDHQGCEATFNAHSDHADATRGSAALTGWVHGIAMHERGMCGPAKSLDYCAEHARDIENAKPKSLPTHARPA